MEDVVAGLAIDRQSGPQALAPAGKPGQLGSDLPATAVGPALPASFILDNEASSSLNIAGVVSATHGGTCGYSFPEELCIFG